MQQQLLITQLAIFLQKTIQRCKSLRLVITLGVGRAAKSQFRSEPECHRAARAELYPSRAFSKPSQPLRRGVVDNAGVLALSKSEFGSERRINISVREKASCGSFLPYDLQVLPPMTLCISLNSDHRTHLINLGCMSENQG